MANIAWYVSSSYNKVHFDNHFSVANIISLSLLLSLLSLKRFKDYFIRCMRSAAATRGLKRLTAAFTPLMHCTRKHTLFHTDMVLIFNLLIYCFFIYGFRCWATKSVREKLLDVEGLSQFSKYTRWFIVLMQHEGLLGHWGLNYYYSEDLKGLMKEWIKLYIYIALTIYL